MPRKSIERSDYYPYHVYNRSIDKAFYPVDLDNLWVKANDLLAKVVEVYGVRIHAFVLMSNHYHLLISTPQENLDKGIAYFQMMLSKWLRSETELKKYSFESRYKWSVIRHYDHFATIYRYIYQNPLRANLCQSVESYKFSTIRSEIGTLNLPYKIEKHDYSFILPTLTHQRLSWLNTALSSEVLSNTRLGLNKSIFRNPQKRTLEKRLSSHT